MASGTGKGLVAVAVLLAAASGMSGNAGSAPAQPAADVSRKPTDPGAEQARLAHAFGGTVRPFLDKYCVGCHGKDKPKGQVDLTAFADLDAVVRAHGQWGTILDVLNAGEMPPAKAKAQPTPAERAEVVAWVAGPAQVRGGQERRRPRPGAGPPPEQRRVRLHHPRPDRGGHPPDQGVPGRPGQRGRLRQQRRVAGHVAGAAEEVPGGGPGGGRAPGAAARGVHLRPAPGGHRDRPRPLRRRSASSTSTSGSRPTWPPTSSPPGASTTVPRWDSHRPRWPRWRRSNGSARSTWPRCGPRWARRASGCRAAGEGAGCVEGAAGATPDPRRGGRPPAGAGACGQREAARLHRPAARAAVEALPEPAAEGGRHRQPAVHPVEEHAAGHPPHQLGSRGAVRRRRARTRAACPGACARRSRRWAC